MQVHPPGEDLRPWFAALRDLDAPLDLPACFGNGNPVEIDVGCGRGLFLYNESGAQPDRNFLGIEVDFREGRRAAARLKRRGLDNARVLGGDVHEAFDRYVPAASVAVVHVYFPDPWWKRRHRRRRVFTDEFVGRMLRVLEPEGIVSSASDVGEYFDVIRNLMDHHPAFVPLPPLPETAGANVHDYLTSFERKARRLGDTIHRGRWQRRG